MAAQVAKKEKVPKAERALQDRLGATVRTCRQNLGITQEELAWRADMHRTYLADIERGARNVTLRSIANLAKALQLSVEGLLFQPDQAGGLPGEIRAAGEILLVEDNPADLELTLRAFQQARLTNPVASVGDGQEALEYLFRTGSHAKRPGGPPQLVLLDLGLPKVSGQEVLQQIKTSPQTKDIPVVILTVSHRDSTILECSRLGAAGYIVKPVGFESFALTASRLNFRWSLVQPPAGRRTSTR